MQIRIGSDFGRWRDDGVFFVTRAKDNMVYEKTLRQDLKVKTFVGTSENAVKTQIWRR